MESNIITTACKILSNVAVVNEINAIRAQVIANRTASVVNGIAKAAMIAVAKEKMRGGVCHFVYVKKNGELREAFGTLTPALVEATTTGYGESRERFFTSAYYDCEKGGWRSFRWETIIKVY